MAHIVPISKVLRNLRKCLKFNLRFTGEEECLYVGVSSAFKLHSENVSMKTIEKNQFLCRAGP